MTSDTIMRLSPSAVDGLATRNRARPSTPMSGAGASSKPLSVVFVLHALGPGGSERVVSTLANWWVARGWSVTIATFEPRGREPYYAMDDRIELRQLGLAPVSRPKWKAVARTASRILALRQVFAERRPDVVVSFLTKTNIMAVQAARGLDIPVIVSERNNPYMQKIDPLWDRARRPSYRRAASIVSMTERAANWLPEKIRPLARVIENPVSLPEGWTNRRQGNQLTAVGRLTPQKGFPLLIRAFAKIAGDFPSWNLVIWGEGDERPKLEAMIEEAGLSDRVSLPGVTNAPGAWVETADLFVLSSVYEGWGIVIVEAMAAGVPVVSFDCPFGPREVIRDRENGLLVPDGDVDALAETLAEAIRDPELRARLSEQGARDAKRYAVPEIAAQWTDLVADVVSNHR